MEEPPADISAKQRANSLDGKTWTRYSISVWSDIRKSPEEHALQHPAMFPSQLCRRLIRMFTREGEALVIDPFAGSGSTVVAARQLGKRGIGLELAPQYVQVAAERLAAAGLVDAPPIEATVHQANCLELLDYVEPESADLAITSPPYWDILRQRRSADYKAQRDYGEEPDDLGKVEDYDEFLTLVQDAMALVFAALKPGAYCCVVVMDLRKKSRFYPFHSDLAERLQRVGFIYDDLIIWDRRQEYNHLRPLGYPYVFRINKVHEYILIFQKPK